MDRGDYPRIFKEVRASNTPSSRDSMEFEYKYVLKKLLMEWKTGEIKRFERGKTGEDIRREGGEMVGIKT